DFFHEPFLDFIERHEKLSCVEVSGMSRSSEKRDLPRDASPVGKQFSQGSSPVRGAHLESFDDKPSLLGGQLCPGKVGKKSRTVFVQSGSLPRVKSLSRRTSRKPHRNGGNA